MSQSLAVAGGVLAAAAYAFAVLGLGLAVLLGIPPLVRALTGRHPLLVVVLAFTMGQGIAGTLWLVVALSGALTGGAVAVFVVLGGAATVVLRGPWMRRVAPAREPVPRESVSAPPSPAEAWLGRLVAVVLVLRGLAALLPTRNDDALFQYLFTPWTIALEHRLAFQPFVTRYALMPLLVEMHSAALFALANLTAVTVWDCLCAAAALAALYVLVLQRAERGVALLAVVFVLTTPGFVALMGAGKVDNATTQYGLASLLWLLVAGSTASVACSGACLGWLIASRYTGAFVLPAYLYLLWSTTAGDSADPPRARARAFITRTAVAGAAALAAFAPMAVKNLILVGHPFAPIVGPAEAFWVWRDRVAMTENLRWPDVAAYPFVWTFAEREGMLGNVSPLFLGALPLWFLYRRHPEALSTRPLLVAGGIALLSWIVLEPRSMYTRFVLVGLCLAAAGMAPALRVALAEMPREARGVTSGALFLLLAFWTAASAWTAVDGVRYAAGAMSPADRYASKVGWDTAQWLNAHVTATERVALRHFTHHRWFLRRDILQRSESFRESQELYDATRQSAGGGPVTAAEWSLLRRRGFRYVVVEQPDLDASRASGPEGRRPPVVFAGTSAAVLEVP